MKTKLNQIILGILIGATLAGIMIALHIFGAMTI